MSGKGRPRGCYALHTLELVAQIRVLRARELTLREIAPHVGVTWNRVWQLCKRHGITSRRDYGTKSTATQIKSGASVPPIDPAKARAITERNKQHWRVA